MAEPEERHYNIDRLNMIFAVASIVLLFALIWMVTDDYSREWKDYQRKFRELEIEKTRVKYDYAFNELESKGDYKALEKQLEEERKTFTVGCPAGSADDEAKKFAAENDLLNQKYRFTKAEYDAARYRYETARARGGADNAHLAKAAEVLAGLERQLAGLKLAVEQSGQRLAQRQKAADDCGARLAELERRERGFQQKTKILQRKLDKIDPGAMNFTNRIAQMVRDLPIIDLANPNYKIEQIVLKDIPEDLNFSKVPTVDRCVTCHQGIADQDYKDASQPFRAHPNLELYLGNDSAHPIDEFGCTVCHGGRGRGTDFVSAAHTPASAQQAEEWEEKYGWEPLHHWEKPMLPKQYVEAGCFQCHAGQGTIKGAEKLNLGLSIIERSGCYTCHTINRYKNWPKPGPDLTKLSSKISKKWAYQWIQSPRTFRPDTWMPAFFDQSNTSDPESRKRNEQEIHAIVAYLFANNPEYPAASIPLEGAIQKGKEIVSSVGCMGCHRIEPRDPSEALTRDTLRREQGPNFSGLGSKTSKAWLYNWLKNPHSYNPRTKMPNLRLSDEEAAHVAAYLASLRDDVYGQTEVPAVDEAGIDGIVLDFLTKSETLDSAKKKVAAMSRDEKLSFAGEKLVRHYGCFACHAIAGFENEKPIGTELTEEGSRPVDRLDFGFVHIDHTRPAWFAQKLKDPRVFDQGKVKLHDEKLRMPNFEFNDEEIEAVTTALLGFVKDAPKAKIVPRTARDLDIERGQELARVFNCQGCHLIEKDGGAIQPAVGQWLVDYNNVSANEAAAVIPSFSPPNLIGEGKKVQAQWLFNFLHDPSTIRPWLKVRMPTYAFAADELNDLVKYFAALDNEESLFLEKFHGAITPEELDAGAKLFSKDYFDCAKCHIVGAQMPGGSPENWAPDFALARSRLKPQWIDEWLKNPQDLLPGTKMPTYFDPAGFEASGPEDILAGDEHKQIRALRNYLMSLTPQPHGQTPPAQ
ncbi:MAG TPA: hypothetical protein DE315_00830 [Candidatus Omnitrophica bacterium]|nr:hypothetical protein [Candidatus Omnitrophota bacterium]